MDRPSRVLWIASLACALACARCHDWDSLTRERSPEGGALSDASTSGNFACRPPFAMVGVWGENVQPQIVRFELGTAPSSCESIAVQGFGAREPIRALASDGDRVLVVGDTGACILTVGATSVSERCTQYPSSFTSAQPIDAFVRGTSARRFAASFAIGTAGTISHLLVEDDQQTLSQQLTLSDAGLSMLTGGAFVRSLQTSHEAPYRLFALRDDREELVSVEQNNTARASVLAPADPPGLYTALGLGPSSALGPSAAMILRDDPSQFAMALNRTKFPSNECSQCTRLAHVIPVNVAPRQQLVACENSGGHPAIFLHETSSDCAVGQSFPQGTHLSRMAIRWR